MPVMMTVAAGDVGDDPRDEFVEGSPVETRQPIPKFDPGTIRPTSTSPVSTSKIVVRDLSPMHIQSAYDRHQGLPSAVVGLTSPVPLVTFRTPPISLSDTLSAGCQKAVSRCDGRAMD